MQKKYTIGLDYGTGSGRDAIIPGYYALESEIAAVGDMFDWFVKHSVPKHYEKMAEKEGINVHQYLTNKEKILRLGESGLLALEWWNGKWRI